MEREEAVARIAEIRAELGEKVQELDSLIAQLGGNDRGDDGRPRFTIIKGGLGAAALPLATLGRRKRHPIAVGVAAAVVGALAVVLAVPAHTTPGGPGRAITLLSIPADPPPALAIGAHVGASTPITSATTAPGAPSPRAPRTAIAPVHTPAAPSATPASPDTGAPAPSSSAPVPPPTSVPPKSPKPTASGTPTPTSSPGCPVVLDASSILQVCVNL